MNIILGNTKITYRNPYLIIGLVLFFILTSFLAPNQTEESVTPSLPLSQNAYDVLKIVDGDTIDVLINDKTERIRLIGINTPETVDPRKSVECFGAEASNKAKSLLAGKKVYLVNDNTQKDRDRYDRLLRYVLLENGLNFNLLMIQEGYAYEYTYDTAYKYQSEFKQAEFEARKGKKGLWADGVCKQ